MSARALPFPWNDYLQFQSDGDSRTASPASFGQDDALAALVEDFAPGGRPLDSVSLRNQFENLCCNRAAKYRRRIRLTERFAERQRPVGRQGDIEKRQCGRQRGGDRSRTARENDIAYALGRSKRG